MLGWPRRQYKQKITKMIIKKFKKKKMMMMVGLKWGLRRNVKKIGDIRKRILMMMRDGSIRRISMNKRTSVRLRKLNQN